MTAYLSYERIEVLRCVGDERSLKPELEFGGGRGLRNHLVSSDDETGHHDEPPFISHFHSKNVKLEAPRILESRKKHNFLNYSVASEWLPLPFLRSD